MLANAAPTTHTHTPCHPSCPSSSAAALSLAYIFKARQQTWLSARRFKQIPARWASLNWAPHGVAQAQGHTCKTVTSRSRSRFCRLLPFVAVVAVLVDFQYRQTVRLDSSLQLELGKSCLISQLECAKSENQSKATKDDAKKEKLIGRKLKRTTTTTNSNNKYLSYIHMHVLYYLPRTNKQTYGDRQMDRQTDRWTDRRTDGRRNNLPFVKSHFY